MARSRIPCCSKWWLTSWRRRSRRFEEHLFGCDSCTARLRELLALRDSVRRALPESRFGTAVTGGFVQRLKDSGHAHPRVPARRRRQRVMHHRARRRFRRFAPARAAGGGAPARPRLGGRRHADRSVHVPFDAASNEVVFIPSITMVRSLGVATQRARLLAVTLDSERVIAEYTFNHRPWGTDLSSGRRPATVGNRSRTSFVSLLKDTNFWRSHEQAVPSAAVGSVLGAIACILVLGILAACGGGGSLAGQSAAVRPHDAAHHRFAGDLRQARGGASSPGSKSSRGCRGPRSVRLRAPADRPAGARRRRQRNPAVGRTAAGR